VAAHLTAKRGRQKRSAKNDIKGRTMAATRIDCDIHPAVGGTRTTLLPYLDDHWKEQVVSRAIRPTCHSRAVPTGVPKTASLAATS
jgi:hypothetical protein